MDQNEADYSPSSPIDQWSVGLHRLQVLLDLPSVVD